MMIWNQTPGFHYQYQYRDKTPQDDLPLQQRNTRVSPIPGIVRDDPKAGDGDEYSQGAQDCPHDTEASEQISRQGIGRTEEQPPVIANPGDQFNTRKECWNEKWTQP